MLGELANSVSTDNFLTTFICLLLIGYFIYKEWPEFKKRITSGATEKLTSKTTASELASKLEEVSARLDNVCDVVTQIEQNQKNITDKLVENEKRDGLQNADMHRYRILRFNTELLRSSPHTKEEFDETLYSISEYETFCRENPDYENNRANLAIENIKSVYLKRMRMRDFLEYKTQPTQSEQSDD